MAAAREKYGIRGFSLVFIKKVFIVLYISSLEEAKPFNVSMDLAALGIALSIKY